MHSSYSRWFVISTALFNGVFGGHDFRRTGRVDREGAGVKGAGGGDRGGGGRG